MLLSGNNNAQVRPVLPDDLTTLCPYTNFCNVPSQHSRPVSSFRPCCGSCSCDLECGRTRNCCTYEMDTYRLEEKEVSSCVKAVVHEGPIDPNGVMWYHMTDTCPSGSKCYPVEANEAPLMLPFSSLNDGLIYINKACAECNNATVLVPWRVGFVCSTMNQVGLITDLTTSVNNRMYSNYQDKSCTVHYIPPIEVDVTSKECFPESRIIRECSSKGERDISTKYQAQCLSFNATYQIQGQEYTLVYANIYCALCNNVTLKEDCNVETDPVKASTGSIFLLLDSSDTNKDLNFKRKEYCREVISFLDNVVFKYMYNKKMIHHNFVATCALQDHFIQPVNCLKRNFAGYKLQNILVL